MYGLAVIRDGQSRGRLFSAAYDRTIKVRQSSTERVCVSVSVSACASECECVCVCVCVCERERERESVCVCVCVSKGGREARIKAHTRAYTHPMTCFFCPLLGIALGLEFGHV